MKSILKSYVILKSTILKSVVDCIIKKTILDTPFFRLDPHLVPIADAVDVFSLVLRGTFLGLLKMILIECCTRITSFTLEQFGRP